MKPELGKVYPVKMSLWVDLRKPVEKGGSLAGTQRMDRGL